MNRRRLLRLAASLAVAAMPAGMAARRAFAETGAIDVEAILNDPQTPVAGDPNGDVSIVAFLDYNCPFCKKSSPDLERFVTEDGHVRLVYKDWPILSKTSVFGARLALAAKFQGKYREAHVALMGLRGKAAAEADMRSAVGAAGVDMTKLDADLTAHEAEIMGLLKRNQEQANALGLKGTPVFLIGPFEVAKALDYDELKEIVADFRARVAK